MSLPTKLTETLLRLPESDRLDLARYLVESIGNPQSVPATNEAVVHRLEDLASEKVSALSEEEFRAELSK
jgi:putative addiction module component (TIGR02574 family)